MCGHRLFASSVSWNRPPGHAMRNCLRRLKKALSQRPLVPMSGPARGGLQRPQAGFTSAIVKTMASLLMTMSIVTADGAMADERSERVEQTVPQRPGMKTEDDYRRFVQ